MDILLLTITIVSLIVALVMSVTAWRLHREEKRRAAARVAALSVAAGVDEPAALPDPVERPVVKAPWKSAAPAATPTHAAGFLGAADIPRDTGSRQKGLALAAVALLVVLSGSLVTMMTAPRGTATAAAVERNPGAPLELVSLTHERRSRKLAVSGLVRNPTAGQPVERLSAVVFLFDRAGAFVTSSRANVDFLKLGSGDESPFVVSLDAPETVARYRVSFRTDEGVVPHIDRRDAPVAAAGEQPVNVTLK